MKKYYLCTYKKIIYKMEIYTRHIGKSLGSSSKIIQLICRANGAEITTDVTNLKGYVDKNLIANLRNIADELEEQNEKLNNANEN
jgi:hypothetical protein